jgi:DNA-binding MarR family transcriptional regulator
MKKENVLGYMFSRGSRCYKKAVSQEMEKFDLTTVQCGIIRILKNYGTMTQAEIAEAYASDRATIGSVIQKLQEKNYLEKKLSGNDRRAYVVSLTPKARKIADEMEEISDSIEKKALEGLKQEEIQTFYKVLDTIYKNLNKEAI